MSNQVIYGTPTDDNPAGILFIPESVAIDMGIGGNSGQGTGSAGTTVAGPIVDFITQHGTVPIPIRGESGVGFYYYQPITNEAKLALSIDTPVGTRVFVTDWEDALLSGPKQVLSEADPSDEGHWTNED